jgi:hypothetical protein
MAAHNVLLVTVALVVVGCGGTATDADAKAADSGPADGSAGGSGGSGATISSYCTQVHTFSPNFDAPQVVEAAARVYCDRQVNCCYLSPTQHEGCVRFFSAYHGQNYNVTLQERIIAGTLVPSMEDLRKCLEGEAKRVTCDGHLDRAEDVRMGSAISGARALPWPPRVPPAARTFNASPTGASNRHAQRLAYSVNERRLSAGPHDPIACGHVSHGGNDISC